MVLLPSPPLVVAITLKEWFPRSFYLLSQRKGKGPFETESIVCYLLLQLYLLEYVGCTKRLFPGFFEKVAFCLPEKCLLVHPFTWALKKRMERSQVRSVKEFCCLVLQPGDFQSTVVLARNRNL